MDHRGTHENAALPASGGAGAGCTAVARRRFGRCRSAVLALFRPAAGGSTAEARLGA